MFRRIADGPDSRTGAARIRWRAGALGVLLAAALCACGGGGGSGASGTAASGSSGSGSSGSGGSGGGASYTVGGSISGLLAGNSVALLENASTATTVSANGSFTLNGALANGTTFTVSVRTQPTGQTCALANASGTIAGADVSTLGVTCSVNSYQLAGSVAGLLANTTLVLQDNLGNAVSATADGRIVFPQDFAYGSAYSVSVQAQPFAQACTLGNASGTVGAGNVTVTVNCATDTPTAAGTASAALVGVPTATGNSATIAFDGGADPSVVEYNRPFVSVTVCPPGATAGSNVCQTIDHIVLDTGSYGLVLRNTALSASLRLPPVSDAQGRAVGTCSQYGGGYSWGSLRIADVYIAGEVAQTLAFADDGDAVAGVASAPASCSSGGSYIWTGNDSENGILGVGVLLNNDDLQYGCASGGCSELANPVQNIENAASMFRADNNGLLIQVPSLAAGVLYSATSGTVIFGIGTRSNNGLGSSTVYATDDVGDFSTQFEGATVASFLDTGSSILFFNDTLTACVTVAYAYCPSPSPLPLSATNIAAVGGTSAALSFSIYAADPLFTGGVPYMAQIGGPFANFQGFAGSYFDWGLPFFLGRSVYVGFEGAATPGGTGPFWAY